MKNILQNIIDKNPSLQSKRYWIKLWLACYISACLLSTRIELDVKQKSNERILRTMPELVSNYSALSPQVKKILLDSDMTYFNTEEYQISITDFLGIWLPIITLKRNDAEMQKAALEASRLYIQKIIQSENIQSLEDFHRYMQTINYKKHNNEVSRAYRPAVVASTKEWDCDDQTLLWMLILHELWFTVWKIDVFLKKKGPRWEKWLGHSFLSIELDPNNPKHAAFITSHWLERKVSLRNGLVYVSYETTAKNVDFTEACFNQAELNDLFDKRSDDDWWSSFRLITD